MAEKKTETKKATTSPKEQAKTVMEEDLNLDSKVTVRNLAGWDVTFARLQDGVGDVVIVANGQQRLSRNEVIAQINNNNKLFTGIDTIGSHATIYIDDAPTRRWVGFDDEDREQNIFKEKLVKDLFSLSQAEFENKLPQSIRTRAEKYAFVETIKKLHLNDFRKIMYTINYTGYKIDN